MNDGLREQFAAWQASVQAPSDDDLANQIRTTEALLLEWQRMLYEAHAHLTRYPERAAGAMAPLLEGLQGEQQRQLLELGALLLEWRRRGGNFDLRKRGEPRVAPRPVEARPSASSPEDEEDEEDEEPPAATREPASRRPEESPVSADALSAWREQLSKKQAQAAVRPAEVPEGKQRSTLVALMQALGDVRETTNMVDIVDEVDALEQITTPERRTQWALLSKPMQRAWLSLLVARTRAVKDATINNPGLRERIKVFILHFPAYAKAYHPGYVNGLQVSHNPEGHSWRHDALQFWEQLKQMTVAPPTPVVEEPPAASASGEAPSVPPASSVVSVPSSRPSEPVEEVDTSPIDSLWPLWAMVRDKRVILLGGEPREPARVRLENAFVMAELEWIPGDNPRRLDSVVERVHQHKVDLVLVLQQWNAHKVTNKLIEACKSSSVPWALVGSY
ncbi:MAG: hypothetical protein EOO75_15410, partial [Myxococcales bacterium]